jgi:hypothetical protein
VPSAESRAAVAPSDGGAAGRGQVIAMAGSGTSRLAKVRAWLTERADASGSPVSLRLLCETAVLRLGVGGAALTTAAGLGWPETRHCTDSLSERLAELQVTVGEGPSADARWAGGPVLVADLDTSASQRRWPLFAPLAVEAGAGALFTLPLCVGAIRIGVLALHRVEAGGLAPAMLTDSLAFAELALRLLLDEQAGQHAGADGPTDLGPALRNPQVHQATGMISAQLGIGMEDAFARLRARAFAARRPLSELAADVVTHKVRFGPTGELS